MKIRRHGLLVDLENANEIPQKSVELVPGYSSTTSTVQGVANAASIPASFVTVE